MEKISVKLLVLAAAIIMPNLVGIKEKAAPIKNAEEISSEELRATARAQNFYVCADSDPEQTQS